MQRSFFSLFWSYEKESVSNSWFAKPTHLLGAYSELHIVQDVWGAYKVLLCPHEHKHFQNRTFSTFHSLSTRKHLTETEAFWKLLPGWRFLQNPGYTVWLCGHYNQSFHHMMSACKVFSFLTVQHGWVHIKCGRCKFCGKRIAYSTLSDCWTVFHLYSHLHWLVCNSPAKILNFLFGVKPA